MSSKKLIFSTLTDELELAVKWRRPSISIITARDPLRFLDLALNLSLMATDLGFRVQHLHATPRQFDLPLRMRDASYRNGALFICTGFSNGGGEGDRNAYTALNIRREWLVDLGIKAVFCPTAAEARILPRVAPDFWVFRHHAYEYPAVSTISLEKVPASNAIALRGCLDPSWLKMPVTRSTDHQAAFALKWLDGRSNSFSNNSGQKGNK